MVALGTPLVEVKEDVLSKAKNGSPEWERLWVRPHLGRRRNEMKPAVLKEGHINKTPIRSKVFKVLSL